MRIGRSREHGDCGAAAVEFALVLPLLVVLLLAIVEFGLAFNAYITVTHTAREAARLASVNQFDLSTIQDRAYPLDRSKLSISGPSLRTDAAGDYYEVTISYPYKLTIPFWDNRSVTLSSTARMRKE